MRLFSVEHFAFNCLFAAAAATASSRFYAEHLFVRFLSVVVLLLLLLPIQRLIFSVEMISLCEMWKKK